MRPGRLGDAVEPRPKKDLHETLEQVIAWRGALKSADSKTLSGS
jgi:hypothetical protein